MPKSFDKCVKGGGRVRTVKPTKGTYVHVCYKGGKSFSGYSHHTKKGGSKKKSSKKR